MLGNWPHSGRDHLLKNGRLLSILAQQILTAADRKGEGKIGGPKSVHFVYMTLALRVASIEGFCYSSTTLIRTTCVP